MASDSVSIATLTSLNDIAETLNRAVDVRSVLDDTLARLVQLMGLETGWMFLKDGGEDGIHSESGYMLAAYHNLPPALDPDDKSVWRRTCDCQELCDSAAMTRAYNEVRCGRLENVVGDRRGLVVHASTPLCSGDRVLGILNVAGPDWSHFSPEALALLTSVGNQIGVALERARLFDLLQERRIHEQAALLDFSTGLLGQRALSDLLRYLVDEVKKMLRADACALLLPGKTPDTLEFRAASGWRVDPVAEGHSVPAGDLSGPGLAMVTQRLLLTEDIQMQDPAPWLPDWLEREGFRGHAVLPLVAEGRSVGALVIDARTPRLLDQHEIRLLRLMAAQAAIAIEKARLHMEELKGQALEREMAVGREIQLSLLPKRLPSLPGWEFASFYEAARQVGGDFYDLFALPGDHRRLGVVVADVAGKGVPAALLMALGRTVIRSTAIGGNSPSTVLSRANDLIVSDSHSDLFLTAFYAALDTERGQMVYSSAGHNPPLWVRAEDGQVQPLGARGTVLGVLEQIELEEREISVAPGDLLVFYTDGVTEAMDKEHQVFGETRLEALLAEHARATAGEVLQSVVDAVREHAGQVAQSDDLTVLVVKRRVEAQ
ncbi:MAG: SpoIIE family protein phosphatase [Anaerolineae bacterium]|nr:SpoIIE family protein phosphatase [Anaerolineae bacterium]